MGFKYAGHYEFMKNAILERLRKCFIHQHGCTPSTIVVAPGRINLIGEHTDYNAGYVLPGAIDRYVYMAMESSGTEAVLEAIDMNETITIDLQDLTKAGMPPWAFYFIGLLKCLKQQGIEIKGFQCSFLSEIPIGAGLSSSSALEMAFLYAINEVFDLGLSTDQMVDISQQSNHHFLGVKGGVMDQFTSLMGNRDCLILLDCQSMDFNYINFQPSPYTLVLIDSGVRHNHVTGSYNDRPAECRRALSMLRREFHDVGSIRQIEEKHLHFLKSQDRLLYRRLQFVQEENRRVLDSARCISMQDWEQLGALMSDSHCGLRDLYEVSTPELDFLQEHAVLDDDVLGARMMGGGFGGCTLNLIHEEAVHRMYTRIAEEYRETFGRKPLLYQIQISDGARVIS